ncbi:MAG: metallophosphoesterase [Novosphingobium sp.]|jgi:3',5'-cyclic AMP phosphodiesterase CpdA|uniref:metallophosphoesterase n=1 Tax=Novosphingobium sp. TaxID=1874826 RepID=UPI0022C9BA0C|nr:metallophosphoesterase [Novosphingobium sp.]MCZ8036491.1 metallophosphoesterase [Novosphingobium sp.]
MQRLWIFSDLHQEWPDQPWDPAAHAPAAGFDVAVVAGDVHTPLTAALDWLATRLAGVPIVYVPGNHDLYWNRDGGDKYTIYDQFQRGRDMASRLGIHLLLDDSVTIGGSRFVGGTLWTDFRLGSHSWVHAASTASARDGMQDYRRIRTGPTSKKRLRPSDVRQMHRDTRTFIANSLAEPHSAGATIVVTHHAPHPQSLANPDDELRWCYASDLSDLMAQAPPALWVHGHIHRHSDYRVGATRVVANPRGHIEERTGFIDDLTIQI